MACSSTRLGGRAPVESLGEAPNTNSAGQRGNATNKPPPPGTENAGKPGYYTVQPGDTLFRVGRENGQNWATIARWNNLSEPYTIEVGQVLRVVPPTGESSTAVTQPVNKPSVSTDGKATPRPTTGSETTETSPTPSAKPAEDKVVWAWPASGPILKNFDEIHNKGLDISGKMGDPINAAADGSVVYASSGLRGYGNLIILKHSSTLLSAYAHNETLLVKENQKVKRGQKIAEMGKSDADRVKLHFEIRRSGKPVDPMRYLPSR
ncbi:unnamed protein product [Darwinula stevensoni]|uniref:LysM domain-containing protein n=1 Tax=Darwinula stevensoni TaxID=69355 RepID=A0A7R9AJI3_9CRUS|nr:unnamed protein product [Darwinula stevensoni]CAG0908719.1 unnamed protein product [Darwinula stevensoni]